MNANARLHAALGRAQSIAARYGRDELAADFAAAQARVEALVVVRLRQTARVVAPTAAMPACGRRRRITTARPFAHRRGALPRAQESVGGAIGIHTRPHAAHPLPVEFGIRARTGRSASEAREAGAQLPSLGGRCGRGRARSRDGPVAAV